MEQDASAAPTRGAGKSIPRRMLALLKRCAMGISLVVAFYFLVVLIGLIPVNNNFATDRDGIEILVTSNPVHADVVLPIETSVVNWRDHFPAASFSGNTQSATHVAIGWGDKGFFLQTPTWNDLKMSTAANALFWPSETCLHVTMKSAVTTNENTRSVRISRQQYAELADFVIRSFRTEANGRNMPIESAGYSWNDAFFEAHGTYHCVNTCNSWVGRALRAAGVRTGWTTPLPQTVFLYLPES
ncbi:MAG TPA: TIGR02117 family protein [Planctomycetes bacterium]|nr:TIGR02117 family protein [Fuerstiella sp.]HIK90889.1 TIGR02117 family protein [Planctomycetota bacterium]